MPNTFTTNYSLEKSEIGGDNSQWGSRIHTAFDTTDAQLINKLDKDVVKGFTSTAIVFTNTGSSTGTITAASGDLFEDFEVNDKIKVSGATSATNGSTAAPAEHTITAKTNSNSITVSTGLVTASAGDSVTISLVLEIGKVDINSGNIDGATIATSDITVGSGKTLDVSGGTLTVADGQINTSKLTGTLDPARLPDATTSAKGGVIAGTNISVSSGTISTKALSYSHKTCTADSAQISLYSYSSNHYYPIRGFTDSNASGTVSLTSGDSVLIHADGGLVYGENVGGNHYYLTVPCLILHTSALSGTTATQHAPSAYTSLWKGGSGYQYTSTINQSGFPGHVRGYYTASGSVTLYWYLAVAYGSTKVPTYPGTSNSTPLLRWEADTYAPITTIIQKFS